MLLRLSPVLASLLSWLQKNLNIRDLLSIGELHSLLLGQLCVLLANNWLVGVSLINVNEALAELFHLSMVLNSVNIETLEMCEDFAMRASLDPKLAIVVDLRDAVERAFLLLSNLLVLLVCLVILDLGRLQANDVREDTLESVGRDALVDRTLAELPQVLHQLHVGVVWLSVGGQESKDVEHLHKRLVI